MVYILSICPGCGSPTKQVKDAFATVYKSEQESIRVQRKSIDSTYRLIRTHRDSNLPAAAYADSIMLAVRETDHFIDSLAQELRQLEDNSRELVMAGDVMRRRNTEYLLQEQLEHIQHLTQQYPALDPAARQQIDDCWSSVETLSSSGSLADLQAVSAITFIHSYVLDYSEAVMVVLRQIDRQLQP